VAFGASHLVSLDLEHEVKIGVKYVIVLVTHMS